MALPEPTGADGAASNADAEKELDEDWFNTFERHAEDASSEQIQQLFGRILADEIKWRGSFSRRCLNFVGSLDRETAELCEWAAERSVQHFLMPDPELRTGGLSKFLELQQLGLIGGVVGHDPMSLTMPIEAGGLIFSSRFHAIQLRGPGSVHMSVFNVSRLGQEVFSLLPASQEKALRLIGEQNKRPGFHVTFGNWRPVDRHSGYYDPTEVIHS